MRAFDTSGQWATRGEGVDSWIKAQFDDTYMVTRFGYQNRAAHEANKGVTLSFSSGASQSFILSDSQFEEYSLSPAVVTSSVTITVTSTYTNWNNGADMISFYGYLQQETGIFLPTYHIAYNSLP